MPSYWKTVGNAKKWEQRTKNAKLSKQCLKEHLKNPMKKATECIPFYL